MNTNLEQPFSAAMLKLISGHYDISSLDTAAKINFLASLEFGIEAVNKCGYVEHTGDWDLRLKITTSEPVNDRTQFGTTEDMFADEYTLIQPDGTPVTSTDGLPVFDPKPGWKVEIEEQEDDEAQTVMIPVELINEVWFGPA